MAKVLNCANTPVDKAIAYAQGQCSADGKSMAEYFSDFKPNYLLLQEKCDLALDLPRIEMPVIEPEQMDEFQESLTKGHIDVNEPVAKAPQSKSKYPTDLGFDLRGRQWLYRGTRDGAIEDDILDAQMTEIAVADLKPSQSQIWLEKVVGMSLYFGPLKQSSEFLHEAPIIVSSDGYILDGHHRFGAAMVSNPSLRLTALKVDMEIRELVKMARSYGNAIGNEQKAAETFEAEMDKVVDVDCVNIVSKKSAFTGKDRNFYRVSFRDSGQYDRFGIPAWASKAAKTMGEKYYGVSGCQMVMGMLPSGKWQIQAILVPNTEKMNKQKALKIANHMQDRIEKEGKWAKKKCRDDEIIQIYQADEYGAESFNAQDTPNIDVGDLHKVADAFKSSGLRVTLRLEKMHDRDTILVLIGLDAPDQKIRDVRAIMKHLGYSNWYAEGKKMYSIAGHATSKLDYTEIKVNGGHEHYRAESFNAMSFNQWSQDEMNEELHGGRNMQFKEWLDDEVHTHGNIPLKEWGYEEEHDEPEHQHAETFEATAYCKECNKEHDWESGYGEGVCGLKCRDSECEGSYDNPEHKGYHINAKHGASTFPACYFGAKCEKCGVNPVAIVAYDDEPYHDEYCSQCWNTNNMVIEGAKQYYQSYNVIPAHAHEIKHMNRIAKKLLNAESMIRKPAYGLFGLSFITGILLNMARKD